MTLPELSIRRHVLTWMVCGVLVLMGLIAYDRMGVDKVPRIEFPMVSVTTVMAGSNPEVMDKSVTNVIESAVNSIPGVEHIMSSSSPGVSSVMITFDIDKNLEVAFNEVQVKINQSLRSLPREIDSPIISKMETGASPVLWFALQGDRTLQQLNLYARNIIKKKIENVDGVGEVRIGGERKRVIRVHLDLNRMAALGLTTQDITRAFSREHLSQPGGFLVSAQTESMLNMDAEFHTLAELEQMVVAHRDGLAIRLRDFASLEDGLGEFRQIARFNGKPSVGIGIVKVSNANTVAVIDGVIDRIEKDIRPNLPAGMTLTMSSNDALYIKDMVQVLKEHIIEGTLLAALVVFLFLKSFRSMLIIAAAIPVSLLAAVAAMYFVGYTFNSMTLLALLLLVGVVVDDAIVVLENIFRHREQFQQAPIEAAVNGSRQVVFAVLAATLTLVSIFGPVIFMGGIVGKFFESFAVVVTVGVMTSWLVSMTLTPMLCSRYLRVGESYGPVYRGLDVSFKAIDHAYRRVLSYSLNHRWKIILIALLVVLSSGYFFKNVGKGFAPDEDQSRFMVTFKTPLGSNIDYTTSRLQQVERVLGSHPEVITYFSAIGMGQAGQVNQGLAFVRMVPRSEREISQQDLVAKLRKELAQIPGVQAFAMQVPVVSGPGARGEPLSFSVIGPTLQGVGRVAEQLKQDVSGIPGMGKVDMDLQLNLPQERLKIDRERTASFGLSAQDVTAAVNMLAGGVDVAKYNDEPGDGERYDVRVKAADGQIRTGRDLSRIYLRSSEGEMVRLDSVAAFDTLLGPAIISRYDLQYTANFFASPTMPLGEAVQKVEELAAKSLPPGYRVKMQGQAEEFAKTMGYLVFAFGLGLVLLYMVLASQFNSFLQPAIIMVAQPLAIIGGVFALYITGETLNIYSMIGMVLLMGLVAKNSILLVDLTNQLRAQGHTIQQALLEACPIRMRPVLMTSLTIILAMLPAALGLGAGAETNGPLSITVIGGMITSTLLTLVVVPAVYSLTMSAMARFQKVKS